MEYSAQTLFADTVEDVSSEDEIDELFSQLLQIEPPGTLVDDILALVGRLPLPQETGSVTAYTADTELVSLQENPPLPSPPKPASLGLGFT
jgi:hypothetical protein